MASESVLDKLKVDLSDRYDIEREVGRGGMATVYLAHDRELDRRVAIKVLNSDLSVAMGAERFRREIALVRELDHPNILALYDAGETNGSLYYVMPFVDGESLAARLLREKQLPVEEALRITCAVADALEYAHKHGIVHRDIKPENILLEGDKVLVADFGIARAITAGEEQKLTQTGMTLGTPTYMSPEQAMAEKNIDGRSDVYSLGCVLYEMLIGQPPFVGPTAQAIIARQMLEDVPSLIVVRESIPDELEDAVLRALAKVPADRFKSTGEFASALKACKASGGASLGRADRRSRSRRRPKREQPSRMRTFAIAALAVAVIGGTSAFFLVSRARNAGATSGRLQAQRIAVLYFNDQSRSGDLQHVADGLTETLIGELSQVRTLDVISPNGVERFRDTQLTRDSIGRLLEAGTLVEGRLEESGDQLRVRVSLYDGNTGEEIDKTELTEPKGDLIAVRDSLANKVAELVRRRVGQEVRLRQARGGTRNAEAWSFRQRGEQLRRDAVAKFQANDTVAGWAQLRSADSVLQLAEERDQQWIEPVVARGALDLQEARLLSDQVRQAPLIDSGLTLAEQALQMDPRDPAALELRGSLRYYKWRYHLATDPAELRGLLSGAEEDLRQATTLDPSRASAWSTLALVFYNKPDFVEGTLATRRAYEEDAYLTNADVILWRLYTSAYDNEQFVDAVKYCDEGRRRFPDDPRFVRCQLWLYTTHAVDSNVSKAWQTVDRLKKLTPERDWPYQEREAQMLVAAAIGKWGLTDSAKRVLVRARANPQIDPDRELLTFEAFVRTLIGDKDEAFSLMKQYLAVKPEHREGLAKSQSWWWRDLRADPRFQELVGGL